MAFADTALVGMAADGFLAADGASFALEAGASYLPALTTAALDTTAGALTADMVGGVGSGITNMSALGGEYAASAAPAVAENAGASAVVPAVTPPPAGASPQLATYDPMQFAPGGSNLPTTPSTPYDPMQASQEGYPLNPSTPQAPGLNTPSPFSSLGDGFNSALNWMGDHPIVTGLGMYFGAKQLGLGRPTTYSTPGASNTMNTGHYNLNPSTFQPGRMPVTQNPVQPTYPNYAVNPYPGPGMASGGIASFRSGGNSGYQNYKDTMGQYELMNQYENMMTGSNAPSQQTPAWVSDQGIVKDTDPTTSKMAAMDAANYNQAKTMAGAGMPTSAGIGMVKPSMNYGSINTDPAMVRAAMAQQQQQIQGAAQGGIMGYSLGGYASGGNPRLLKGPGDGMSDNIPATIGDRQPARLADGEFVVPADVVSHLGNGSTDAGAQKLHTMMDKVRMDRTGKKKQAPAVKADKYIPK